MSASSSQRGAQRPVSAAAAHYRKMAQVTDAMYGERCHDHRIADDSRRDGDDDYAARRQRQPSSRRKRQRQQRQQQHFASFSALHDCVSDSIQRRHAHHQSTEHIEVDEEDCSEAIVLSPPSSLPPLPAPLPAAALLPLPCLPFKSAFACMTAAPSVYRDEPVFKRRRRSSRVKGTEAELRLIRVRAGTQLSVGDDVIESDREREEQDEDEEQQEAREDSGATGIAAPALIGQSASHAASAVRERPSAARIERSPELGGDDSESEDIDASPVDTHAPTEPQTIDLTAQPPSPSLGSDDDGDDGEQWLQWQREAADERKAQQARQRALMQLRIDNYRSISTRHSHAAAAQAQQLAVALALLQGSTQADDEVEEVKMRETLKRTGREGEAADSNSEQRSRMADIIACQRYANPEVQLSSLCKLPLITATPASHTATMSQ